ncbi:MAG: ABC transporter substrate-binding protein [Microcoleus vaginatus WJT46-NPBG5]|jgi:ABC-type nitrate/sulfonate/bicarbonate transport system substrate-binding protein|nr:ABC transporter substrate-binding protein [Microcoleus vaginatus WJT46-NPBG5]
MSNFSAQYSRRKFLITAGASAVGSVFLKGCLGNPPESISEVTRTQKVEALTLPAEQIPETKSANIGFIGQTDAAPLIIAQELGFFAKYGVPDIKLQKQPSWAVIRDKLELDPAGGGIEAGMVLTPMPYLMALGAVTKGNKKIPMYLPLRLNVDGQGITVADSLKGTGVKLDTSVLKQRVQEAKAAGKPLRFAHTFKGGTSDIMLRYWLAAGGIDPENDVVIQIVPGAQLVSNMQTGDIQGFCVGEPWHLRAINQKVGYTALITGEFWKDHPEKALAFRADWVDKHPKTTKAILKAVMEAQQWCDKMENREEMAQLLSRDEYAKVPVKDIIDRLKGKIDYGDGRPVAENSPHIMRYWEKGTASYPYQSHDLWFLTENMRWGMLPADTDTKAIIKQVNREDLWREAANEMGVTAAEIPKSPSKGVEKFFDGVAFNPADPVAYLKNVKIKKI